MGFPWFVNGGDPNYLLIGMILQVPGVFSPGPFDSPLIGGHQQAFFQFRGSPTSERSRSRIARVVKFAKYIGDDEILPQDLSGFQ